MALNNYKVYKVHFKDDRTNFEIDLELKLNINDEYDIHTKITFNHNLTIREIDRNLDISNIVLIGSGLNNNVYGSCETNYILNADEMKLIKDTQPNTIDTKLIEDDKPKPSVEDTKLSDELNLIIDSLVQHMELFKTKVGEFNKTNCETVLYDETPIISYIENLPEKMTITTESEVNFDDELEIEEDKHPFLNQFKKTAFVSDYEEENKTPSITISNNHSEFLTTLPTLTNKQTKYKIKNEIKSQLFEPLKRKPLRVEPQLVKMLNNSTIKFSELQVAPNSRGVNDTNSVSGNSSSLEDIEEKLYYHLQLMLSMDHINIINNIIFIVTELMKFIDNYNIKGIDKKQIILNILNKTLVELNASEQDIKLLLDTLVPELIDILISIDKRRIIIKKKLSCFLPWCI